MKLFKVAIVGVNIATVNFEETPAQQEQGDSLHIDAFTDFKPGGTSVRFPFSLLPIFERSLVYLFKANQSATECCLLTDKILPWADCRQHCREQLTGGWQTSEVLFASQVQADRQESLPVNGGTIEKYWHRQLSTEGRRLEFSQIWNKILWKSKGKQVASIWLWELLRESWGLTGLKGRFRGNDCR